MFGRKIVGYSVRMEFEPCEPELDCHTLVEPARDSKTSRPIVFPTPSAAQDYIDTHTTLGVEQKVMPIKK